LPIGELVLPAKLTLEHYDLQVLETLLEVARALDSCTRIRAGLNRALEIVEKYFGATRSAVVVRASGTSELRIEASRGLTSDEQRAFLRIEDGLTDRVMESGKPVVVPKAGGESLFFQRGGARTISQSNETTFVCVPIIIDRATSGALGVDMRYEKNRDYDHILGFLGLIASMMAQAFRIAHLSDAEKQHAAGAPAPHREQVREQAGEQHDFSNLIGNSGPMQQVYEQIGKVARSNATVMVRGESGTGKELIAHAIHYNSLRKGGPFIKVNCAALPDTLIESELFGYEKGAFTGAQAQKKGRFELAAGGTLFLDEIGEVNAATAVKLLRVLQEREFERVGGTRTVKADVRLIVATNKDLEKAILAGAFREDLFYRLNVFSIFIPPLRERKPDVLLLADHFLDLYNSAHGKDIKRISTPAIDMLMSYHWPGNVRELSNTIERAVLICDEHVIHGYHLPPTLQTAEATGTVLNVSLQQSVEAYEKDLIHDTLKTTRGNRARAAKLLRTTERVINYKARKYAIDCVRLK
jgi:Nif-specific regulatory protein